MGEVWPSHGISVSCIRGSYSGINGSGMSGSGINGSGINGSGIYDSD